MKAVLGFLGSAWSGLKAVAVGVACSEAAGSGGYDDEAGYAGAGGSLSTSSDSEG